MTTGEVHTFDGFDCNILRGLWVSRLCQCSTIHYSKCSCRRVYRVKMKLHTSGLCVSATIGWKLSSDSSTAMQFHSTSLCTYPMDM